MLVPEVIQTSAMDCGPAALKALLEGYRIPVSYGRLREACQTGVDGTSIDTLEEIARALGLEAEQVMLPPDHLLLPEAKALPALLVVRQSSGLTHFVVVWGRHGRLFQVMDPAAGRRWVEAQQLLRETYVHEHVLPAADWYAWARSEGFLAPLRRRLADLGLAGRADALIAAATAGEDWRALARLDAALRLLASLVAGEGVRRGAECAALIDALLRPPAPGAAEMIPAALWSARAADPADPADDEADAEEDGEQLTVRGAVLIQVSGVAAAPQEEGQAAATDLSAALDEAPPRPARALLGLLRHEPALHWTALLGALAAASGALILEALILRGLLDVGGELRLVMQRASAFAALLALAAGLLLLELGIVAALLRLGRQLEARLRMAILAKLPRLADPYFRSRPVSDMAERSHALHQLRGLPRLAGQLVRAVLGLVLTVAALVWLHPGGAPLALAAGFFAAAVPLAWNARLAECDLRQRTHTGALTRFILDALLGLTAIHAHGAQTAVRREHESLLVEWGGAALRVLRTALAAESLQSAVGLGFAVALVLHYVAHSAEPGAALLLAWWALSLPVLGEEIALHARQYPTHRNLALRLLELLGAPEDCDAAAPAATAPDGGVALRLEGVTVFAGGRPLLEDIDLALAPGSHVAIVGASGAGKSTLVGTLLGHHRPAQGRVLADGAPLEGAAQAALLARTVWIDPAVQLWNRSLLHNLRYGHEPDPQGLAAALEEADLHDTLARLPDGLQTVLGEGGGRLSGGEGQRVRVGRGLLRAAPRLVVLDEAFRGLERERRERLLQACRRRWRNATLLCVTHDLGSTRDFDRVLVVEGGRIVEDAAPGELMLQSDSRYAALLAREAVLAQELWDAPWWRRLRLAEGRLAEEPRP
jgi:ATP-binding cassette subfamily B protein